jgi:Leu/Phe-tRNA-protein transferase
MSAEEIRDLADRVKSFVQHCSEKTEGHDDYSWFAIKGAYFALHLRELAHELEQEELAR